MMSIPSALLPSFEKMREFWKRCESNPDRAILRLAILRDLQRALHAQQSHFLAVGEPTQARSVQQWETVVETLRTHALDTPDLDALLLQPDAKPRPLHPLPPGLFQAIERSRLERLDRAWEAALAARACELGWKFWKLSVELEISKTESWNQKLAETLWPKGIILYTESGEFLDRGKSPSRWRGNWTLLLSPQASPDEFSSLTGESAQWKPLFDSAKGTP